MKTPLEITCAIFRLLNVPAVKTVITGGVYKFSRPTDSKLEDIVIKSLFLGRGTRQKGVSNVNIYAPDIQVETAAEPTFIQDAARLLTLTEFIVSLFEEADMDDIELQIERTQTFNEPAIDQHYMNIRLRVTAFNFH